MGDANLDPAARELGPTVVNHGHIRANGDRHERRAVRARELQDPPQGQQLADPVHAAGVPGGDPAKFGSPGPQSHPREAFLDPSHFQAR